MPNPDPQYSVDHTVCDLDAIPRMLKAFIHIRDVRGMTSWMWDWIALTLRSRQTQNAAPIQTPFIRPPQKEIKTLKKHKEEKSFIRLCKDRDQTRKPTTLTNSVGISLVRHTRRSPKKPRQCLHHYMRCSSVYMATFPNTCNAKFQKYINRGHEHINTILPPIYKYQTT